MHVWKYLHTGGAGDLPAAHWKGAQLRRAGLDDWGTSRVQMMIPDARVACAVGLWHNPALASKQQRVERFTATTGASRATYFRIKAGLVSGLWAFCLFRTEN